MYVFITNTIVEFIFPHQTANTGNQVPENTEFSQKTVAWKMFSGKHVLIVN